MHELLILRHGKSDWPAGVGDFDRPLKKRGKRDARRIGHWLRDNGLIPDLIVSSPAERAIDTARRTADAMGLEPDQVRQEQEIYLASVATLMKLVRNLPPPEQRVMIVGHNPSLEDLLATLAKVGNLTKADTGSMSTAALAVLQLPGEWADAAPQSATLTAKIQPRDLPASD